MRPTLGAVAEVEAEAQRTYEILGREVRLPVEVREATAAIANYLVPARAAQRLIEASGLRVATVLPGRTLCTIGTMDYRDGDLGQYYEISVSFFVQEHDARAASFARNLRALARGRLPAYIHQLPVNGDFTCEAGQKIWGFPKFVTEIELREENGWRTSVLRADGEHILTQRVRVSVGRTMPARAQVSYAHRAGALYRTPSTMSGEGFGVRLGGAAIELGEHPIANELRSLGLPKRALFSMSIGHMRATFQGATKLV